MPRPEAIAPDSSSSSQALHSSCATQALQTWLSSERALQRLARELLQQDATIQTPSEESRAEAEPQPGKLDTEECASHSRQYTHFGGEAPSWRKKEKSGRGFFWFLSHHAWNKWMHALHGNTTAPRAKNHELAVCPDGHTGAERCRGAGTTPFGSMYSFTCLTCKKRFKQLVPSKLQPGQNPRCSWVDTRGETPSDEAPAASSVGSACHGDVRLLAHNAQGLGLYASLAVEYIEQRVLRRAEVGCLMETGWNEQRRSWVPCPSCGLGRLHCTPV